MTCDTCARQFNYCFYLNDEHWRKVVGEERFKNSQGRICAHCALESLGGLDWYIIHNEPGEKQRKGEQIVMSNESTDDRGWPTMKVVDYPAEADAQREPELSNAEIAEKAVRPDAAVCVNHCGHDPRWTMDGVCRHMPVVVYPTDDAEECGHRCPTTAEGERCSAKCDNCEPSCVCFYQPSHEGKHDHACQFREPDAEADAQREPEQRDWTVGDVIAAYPDGTIVLDDGITTWNDIRAKEFLAKGKREPRAYETFAYCPITGRPFFMNLEHPEMGEVPTFGGPFDSYTIPEVDDDGGLYCERYDHDAGIWIEGCETLQIYLTTEQPCNHDLPTWVKRHHEADSMPCRHTRSRPTVEAAEIYQTVLKLAIEIVKQSLNGDDAIAHLETLIAARDAAPTDPEKDLEVEATGG